MKSVVTFILVSVINKWFFVKTNGKYFSFFHGKNGVLENVINRFYAQKPLWNIGRIFSEVNICVLNSFITQHFAWNRIQAAFLKTMHTNTL